MLVYGILRPASHHARREAVPTGKGKGNKHMPSEQNPAPRTFGQPMLTAAQALSMLVLVMNTLSDSVHDGASDTDTAREVIARLRRVYGITD